MKCYGGLEFSCSTKSQVLSNILPMEHTEITQTFMASCVYSVVAAPYKSDDSDTVTYLRSLDIFLHSVFPCFFEVKTSRS